MFLEYLQSIRNDFTLELESKCLNKVCDEARQIAWLNDPNLLFIIDEKKFSKKNL